MFEVTKYHNDLNTVKLRRWTSEEMNFFFAVLTKAKEQGTKELKFDTQELRALSGNDFKNADRWIQTMERTAKKITELTYIERTEKTFEIMTLFQKLRIDIENRTVVIQLSDNFEYILNNLQANFTKFELEEFTQIRSSYAKTLYRQLKQWRTIGRKSFRIEEFRELLDIPSSYLTGQIDRSVIKPCLIQLSPFFKNLSVQKIKAATKGSPVLEYSFSWEKEGSLLSIEKELIDNKKHTEAERSEEQRQRKNSYYHSTVGTNVPEWLNSNYKTETGEKEIKELSWIKAKMTSTDEKEQEEVIRNNIAGWVNKQDGILESDKQFYVEQLTQETISKNM